MNGYSLSRKWFDFCFENPERIKPIHTAIYFFAIEHCNRLGWKKKFGFPTTMVMEAIGVNSYNTYRQALDDIVSFGFLELLEKSKNQYSSNIIALSNFDEALDEALDKALTKHASKQRESTGESKCSIDKQTNHRTNKQINTDSQFSTTKKTSVNSLHAEAFERVWILYGKRGSKKLAYQEWIKLSDDDRSQAEDHIPLYVDSVTETRYIKHFERYLKQRHFESEPPPRINIFSGSI